MKLGLAKKLTLYHSVLSTDCPLFLSLYDDSLVAKLM
jgi:hypothetical protein